MIFAPEHIEMIARGDKTMTRRVLKSGERVAVYHNANNAVVTAGCRIKWQVGRDYAVQPGRGLPAAKVKDGRVWMYAPRFALAGGPGFDFPLEEWHKRTADWHPLRIRITAIRGEKLLNISHDDARAEGYEGIYISDALPYADYSNFADAWDSINTRKGTRFWDNPSVWVLTFERVQP